MAPPAALSLSLLDWAGGVVAPLMPARHHQVLLAALSDLADGASDRLMVLMPPGSAKSTYCSVAFPPWWLLRFPRDSVIAAAHTESLAHHFGRRARAAVVEHGGRHGLLLTRDDRAAGRWRTEAGGEYFAAGVRGPIVGRRADLIVIDDPIKGYAEADSPNHREAVWQWFQSDLISRLKPSGRIVLVMTRWHEDDLAGRLLASGDAWRTVRLPALAEADDPLGRAPEEPLWPDWETLAELSRKRRGMGERMWAALYQQRPRPDGDGVFRVAHVLIRDRAPASQQVVRAWDLAATEPGAGRDPDWTVGVKLARLEGGDTCVLDVIRFRGASLAVERAILAAAEADGPGVAIGLPQDPGQAGKQQVEYLTRRLPARRVVASPETGSKLVRARAVSAQVEAGQMSLVQAPWNGDFLAELRDFPNGTKDDQVDALSRGFALLMQFSPSRTVRLDHMAR